MFFQSRSKFYPFFVFCVEVVRLLFFAPILLCVCVCVCVYLHIQDFSHILSALLADPSPNSLPVSYSQGFETSDRCSPEAHSNTTGPCKWSVMRGCCTTGCFRSAFRVNKMRWSAYCVRNVEVKSGGFTWSKHDPQYRFSHTELYCSYVSSVTE